MLVHTIVLLQEASLVGEMLRGPNIPFTLLLAVCLIYWITVMFGALNLEFLDVDLDGDTELGIHANPDGDTDIDGADGHGFWMGMLAFINAGKVPFMIVLTVLITCLWAASILYNHYLGWLGGWVMLALFIPNLIVAFFLTKLFTTPLVRVFRGFYESQETPSPIGQVGMMRIGWEGGRFGLADVFVGKRSFDVRVRGIDGTHLRHGTQVIIVQHGTEPADLEHDIFLAQPVDHS